MESSNCVTCAYNVYDEDDACYYCEANMDEDDAVRMMERQYRACPFYAHGRPKEYVIKPINRFADGCPAQYSIRNGDEYAVVRKQI